MSMMWDIDKLVKVNMHVNYIQAPLSYHKNLNVAPSSSGFYKVLKLFEFRRTEKDPHKIGGKL